MNKTLLLALAAVGLIAGGTGIGYWVANRNMTHGGAAPVTAAAATADRKPLYWHDPMYPQQKFDKPGKSPFMDMALVPVYADDAGGAADNGAVRISPRLAQNLGIRTAPVTQGAIDRKVQVVGAVAFDERAVVLVQARVSGYIEKLFVRAPLDAVTKGQPLAEILAPDWVAAQEEYLALKRSPQASDVLKLAARQRLLVLGMAESAIAAIDVDGKPRPRVTLVAPVSGVVGELLVREGMTVMPGAPLFRLNGLSTVWIQADVPEAQAAWLKPGSAVEASVPAYPGEVFKGRVSALLPEVNATTRTQRARIEVANVGNRLAPGMFATVSVASLARPPVLLVPSEAIIATGKRSVVIAVKSAGDGKQQFFPTDVETGAEANGMTEIRKGLDVGAMVVLSGQFLIDSESSLKTTVARMSDPAAPAGEAAMPAAAPAAMPAVTHKGEGKVEMLSKDSITISHGPIDSLKMGAMTMEYQLAAGLAPAGIKVGSEVSFDVQVTPKGEMAVTRIAPKGGGQK
jgi:Cu(I)/Ag(I) efflux system membrane fusion protein